MATFQNQAMQEKELYLKKIDKRKLNIFVVLFFFFCLKSFSLEGNEINKLKVINHIKELNEFSSKFIQTNGETLEEGMLYIKNKRLKVSYFSPSKIDLIIAENKAMYFNKDLQEVEYFNPKKSIANIFFKIFYDQSFFNKVNLVEEEQVIRILKNIVHEKNHIDIEIIFESSPLVLRKIIITENNNLTTYSIIDPNFHPTLDDEFFSMAHPIK